jgi:hypothetical protein
MRRAFHFASAISLLLFVAAASLWGRSHVGGDDLSFVAGNRRFVLRAAFGQGVFESLRYTRPLYAGGFHWDAAGADGGALYRSVPLPNSAATRMGFWSADVSVRTGTQTVGLGRVVGAPLWSVALLTGLLPTLWIIDARRGRRPRRHTGLCANCAYDLRASTDRCPECGTPLPATAGAGAAP